MDIVYKHYKGRQAMKNLAKKRMVRLIERYEDTGFTWRITEAGTEGDAYPLDAACKLWKVFVTNQPWGNGEITMRVENLEFLD